MEFRAVYWRPSAVGRSSPLIDGGNTSVITVVTAMYPLFSVVLAMLVLHERLTKWHFIGLGFAAASFVIFAF